MVVIDLPFASLIDVAHALTASPSRWIVQAPQAAIPQPNFVPVNPSTSRRYQSTGIDGSPSNDCAWPFTFRVSMLPSLSKAAALQIAVAESDELNSSSRDGEWAILPTSHRKEQSRIRCVLLDTSSVGEYSSRAREIFNEILRLRGLYLRKDESFLPGLWTVAIFDIPTPRA